MKTKRIACAAVCCLLCLLCGCSGTAGRERDTSDTVTQQMTETYTEAKTETETETEPATETETETETETAAETEEPEPLFPPELEDDGVSALEIAPDAEGTVRNPLTGEICDAQRAQRRPVAVMLNNIAASLPQNGISRADVVYECQVEGGLTRLMGVFNNYEDLKALGSVRSSREYFIDFAANHNAVYLHAGGSDAAYVQLKSRRVNNIDAVNDWVVAGFFYRDPVRRQTMAYEHTLVIDGTAINEAIAAKGYAATYREDFANPFHFVGAEQSLLLSGGTAEEIQVRFAAHTAAFTYDAESGRYLRFQNGKAHTDGDTGEQLAFSDVLILFCPYRSTYDDYNHITVQDTGSGKGYLAVRGKWKEICWRKESGDAPLMLTYEGGREVYLNPGKVFVEVVSSESAVTVN